MGQPEQQAEGAGPFVTRLTSHPPGGGTVVWESRDARRRGTVVVRPPGAAHSRHARADAVSVGRLRRRNVIAASAFVIGGALFSVGAGIAQFGMLFLISGHLGFAEICHGGRPCARPRSPGWWIVAVNQLGSALFMVSAVAAFDRPATGDLVSTGIANWGTLTGALCFSVAGVLQLCEHP
ncbi:hypothetical protein [Streptomyces sp. NPDC003667]